MEDLLYYINQVKGLETWRPKGYKEKKSLQPLPTVDQPVSGYDFYENLP